MTEYRAIIDTQALVYLAKLEQTQPVRELLPNLFKSLLVPQEVVAEFNKGLLKHPEGFVIADAIDRGDFLRKCTSFDSGTLHLMYSTPKVHLGEAEAVAQHLAVNADFVWSDDRDFRAAILRLLPNVRICSTLHIVAMLDLHGYLIDFPSFVICLHRVRSINEGNFIHCYREVAKDFGYPITQKELAAKINFKSFGILG